MNCTYMPQFLLDLTYAVSSISQATGDHKYFFNTPIDTVFAIKGETT